MDTLEKKIHKGLVKARVLRIISFLFIVLAIVLKVIKGGTNTNMLIFGAFFGLMLFAIFSALSLFPLDWKTRAFQPARRDEEEKIEDKMQMKIIYGWINVVLMLFFSLAIFFYF